MFELDSYLEKKLVMKQSYTSELIEEETMDKETIADTKTKLEQMEQDYQFARLEHILEGLSNLHNIGALCSDHCKIRFHQKWELSVTTEEVIWFHTGDGTQYKITVEKSKY